VRALIALSGIFETCWATYRGTNQPALREAIVRGSRARQQRAGGALADRRCEPSEKRRR
jgi:hypothetical protein